MTCIYYLLTADSFSAFHRIDSDELWHHYAGSSVLVDAIGANGEHRELTIGDGRSWQAVLLAGTWFAAHVVDPIGFALLGCDVAPGFDFEDFEVGAREDLSKAFPELIPLIERWTRVD